jgi:hypothetical protein
MKRENHFRARLSTRRQNQLHAKSIELIESDRHAVGHKGSIQIHLFEGSSRVEITVVCPLPYRRGDIALRENVYRLAPAAIARIRKHPDPSVAHFRVQL